MSHPIDDESWETPQLRAARANLRAAVERGRHTLMSAQQVKAGLRPSNVSDADIRRLDRAAWSHDAPPELRALAERVERGEFSWRQIVDGEVMDDPGVRAAFQTHLDRLAQVYRKFEEGYPLNQVLDSETSDQDGGPDGGSVLRRDGW